MFTNCTSVSCKDNISSLLSYFSRFLSLFSVSLSLHISHPSSLFFSLSGIPSTYLYLVQKGLVHLPSSSFYDWGSFHGEQYLSFPTELLRVLYYTTQNNEHYTVLYSSINITIRRDKLNLGSTIVVLYLADSLCIQLANIEKGGARYVLE